MVIVGVCVSSSSGSAAGVLVLDGAGATATRTESSQAPEDVGDAGGSEAGMGFSSGCGSAGLLDGDALNRRREGHRGENSPRGAWLRIGGRDGQLGRQRFSSRPFCVT